jgi:ankyrin repeat protein/uncharacterized protein YjbI with pentapeptide repeats
MQEKLSIEIVQNKLACQQIRITAVLESINKCNEKLNQTEKKNTLRYTYMLKSGEELNHLLSIFAERFRETHAKLQSLAEKIEQSALFEHQSLVDDLGKIITEFEQVELRVKNLVHYQELRQKCIQLDDTQKENIFFLSLKKEIGKAFKKKEIDLQMNETVIDTIVRTLTLHFTPLLHALSAQGSAVLAKEIVLKFINYLLHNQAALRNQDFSLVANQSWIDAILKTKGSTSIFGDGQEIELLSEKKINTDQLFQHPEQWEAFPKEALWKNYKNVQICVQECFKQLIIDDIKKMDSAFSQVDPSIILLSHDISCKLADQSAKSALKSSTKLINKSKTEIITPKVIVHQATRYEIETYAYKHRMDDPEAKGCFREYIRTLYYPSISDIHFIKIDAKALNLKRANLIKGDFSNSGIDFTGTNFRYSACYKTNFLECELQDTDFLYAVTDQALFPVEKVKIKTTSTRKTLELQEKINNKLQEKSRPHRELMKLINHFFDDLLLLANSSTLSKKTGKKLVASAPLFCQAYLDSGVSNLKIVLAKTDDRQKQSLIQNFVLEMQAKLKQWETLGNLDDALIRLEGIELAHMSFSGLSFWHVSVTVDQLLRMKSVKTIQDLDPEKVKITIEKKYETSKNILEKAIKNIQLYDLFIDACEHFDVFCCDGEMPILDQVPEQLLKACIFLALNSYEINTLPHAHKLSLTKMSSGDDQTYLNQPLEQQIEDIKTVLAHQNFKLRSDETAWISYLKMSRFYANIDGFCGNIAGDVKNIALSDLDAEQAIEITRLVDELQQLHRKHKTEKIKLTKADQRCVNNFLQNLHAGPSAIGVDTAEERLDRIADILNSNSDVILDLRTYQLSADLAKRLKANTCQLIITSDQFNHLLTKQQQLDRNDAFQKAIKENDLIKVKTWINVGIDINAKASDGRTPIMDACFHAYLDIAEFLLSQGADLDVATPRNISIIDAICLLDDRSPAHIRIIDLLKNHGVTPHFHNLICIGDFSAVKTQIDSAIEEAKNSDQISLINRSLRGDTPLHCAAQFGQLQIAALLLKYGADPLLPNTNNQLSIEIACWHGHVEIVRLLLNMNTDINRKNSNGRTLLFMAAKRGFKELANLFIQHGAEVDRDSAILLNHYDAIKRELSKQPIDDSTLLFDAIELGAEDTAIFLVEQGLSLTSHNKYGRYPIELATEKNLTRLLEKILLNLGVEAAAAIKQCKHHPLFMSVRNNNPVIAEYLLKGGAEADLIQTDLGGITCLHHAVKYNRIHLVKLLLSYNASTGIRDHKGYTPLHLAAIEANVSIIRCLLQGFYYGKTKGDKTPRDLLPKNADPLLFDLLNGFSQENQTVRFELPEMDDDNQENILIKGDTISAEQEIPVPGYKVDQLLSLIGEKGEDYLALTEHIQISREEVAYTVCDLNHYYTADVMNILLAPLDRCSLSIKVYSAVPVEQFKGHVQNIKEHAEDYAFIPLNVAYDHKNPEHLNHWAALIIDKKNQQIYYFDPALKTDITQHLDQEAIFGFTKPIIFNPILFQKNEIEQGWIRHCGPYVIALFMQFAQCIRNGQYISGCYTPDDTIKNSIAAQTAFSNIPCGDAEIIMTIRENHIDEMITYLQNLTGNLDHSLDIEEPAEQVSSSLSSHWATFYQTAPVSNEELELRNKNEVQLYL